MGKITQEDVVEIAKGVTTEVEWEHVDFKESLTEQGVDSLDMINIIFAFQDKYGITISDESITKGEWLTVDRMVQSLNKELQDA